jgi:hypothetical protein
MGVARHRLRRRRRPEPGHDRTTVRDRPGAAARDENPVQKGQAGHRSRRLGHSDHAPGLVLVEAVRPDQQKYARLPMSTRKLIILALLCGIAIVGAFVVQLVLITR